MSGPSYSVPYSLRFKKWPLPRMPQSLTSKKWLYSKRKKIKSIFLSSVFHPNTPVCTSTPPPPHPPPKKDTFKKQRRPENPEKADERKKTKPPHNLGENVCCVSEEQDEKLWNILNMSKNWSNIKHQVKEGKDVEISLKVKRVLTVVRSGSYA